MGQIRAATINEIGLHNKPARGSSQTPNPAGAIGIKRKIN